MGRAAARPDDLDGRVAVVTGAGGAIGRAAALALAQSGARMFLSDIDPKGLDETKELVAEAGGDVDASPVDISDPVEVEAYLAATLRRFGRLDIAFNNAGVEGCVAPIDEYDDSDWLRTVAVNLNGTYFCMKHEVRAMRATSGTASIINNASILGAVGRPGVSAYVATKHAVVGLVRSAALDYAAEGIRVNAVLPGVVSPGMIDRVLAAHPERLASVAASQPVGRFGRPEEVASVVRWLSSDSASLVTGTLIPIDGGYLAQ